MLLGNGSFNWNYRPCCPVLCKAVFGSSGGFLLPPSLTADFNGDEAIWGWARAETTGNLCLGSREAVPERVGGFLAGLVSRKDEVRPAAGPFCNQGPKHSCETRGPIPNTRQMHIPLWLWFSICVS